MSLINRMLSDLDRRGAGAAPASAEPATPPTPPPRRRSRLRSLGPIVLALALVAVAAALAYQRADQLTALWAGDKGEPAQGNAAEAASEPAPPLARVSFDARADGVELHLATQGALPRPPGYSRDGERVRLRVAAVGAGGVALPAPPAGQELISRLQLARAGDPAVFELTIAPDARVDVTTDDDGVALRAVATAGNTTGAGTDEPATESADAGEAGGAGGDTAGAAADGGAAGQAQENANADAQGGQAKGSERADATAQGDTQTSDAASNGQPEEVADADATNDGEAAAANADADPTHTGDSASGTAQGKDGAESQAGTAEQAGDAVAVDSAAPNDTAKGSIEADATAAASDGNAQMHKEREDADAVRAKRRYRTALDAMDAGDIARARHQLRQALAADPDLHPARELLVALLRRAGDTEAARNVLTQGLERAPERAAYAKPMARLLADAGELARAAQVLSRAEKSGSGDPGYHALRGAVAQRLDRHEEAIAAYTRALEADSGRGQWWLGLAISLAAAEHPEQARSAFREARASGDLSPKVDRWAQQRIEALARSGGG
jgi:MSHA biogenesis protein MshN